MNFYIDLDEKNLDIKEYSDEVLKEDLEFFSVKNAMDLNDYDFKVFSNYQDALSFIHRYSSIKSRLSNDIIRKQGVKNHLLYKRKYMIQTIMGLKNQTVRSYYKPFKKGELLNLYDQTYFLTVEITNVVTNKDNETTYYFKSLINESSFYR